MGRLIPAGTGMEYYRRVKIPDEVIERPGRRPGGRATTPSTWWSRSTSRRAPRSRTPFRSSGAEGPSPRRGRRPFRFRADAARPGWRWHAGRERSRADGPAAGGAPARWPVPACVVWEASAADARPAGGAPGALAASLLSSRAPTTAVVRARGARRGGPHAGTPADPLPADAPLPPGSSCRPPAHDRSDAALAFGLKALTSDLRARRDDALVGLERRRSGSRGCWALRRRGLRRLRGPRPATAPRSSRIVWRRASSPADSLRDSRVRPRGRGDRARPAGRGRTCRWPGAPGALRSGPRRSRSRADRSAARWTAAPACRTRAFLDARTGAASPGSTRTATVAPS